MSANARTMPLRPTLAGPSAVPLSADGAERRARRIALAALATIALGSLLIVAMAADRPSFLSATSHTNFFPRWMAGPLGGEWPWLTRSNVALRLIFSGAVAAMYVAYVLAIRHAPQISRRRLLLAIVAVHVIFFLAPPLALTDIFNYVNYARMAVVHHLNPYTTTPILEPHNDPSFALSNWHQLLSPYGPLFTMLSFAVVPLGVAGSFWAFKAILMLASLGTLVLVERCARLLGLDATRALLLVGLNPVVLVWGLGGDHNDFIMVFCLMLGFYLLLRAERPDAGDRVARLAFCAGAVLAAAIAVKASAGVVAPIILASQLHDRRRLAALGLGLLSGAVLLGAASLLVFGAHLPDLSTQSSLVTMMGIPNLLGLALGQGGETGVLHDLLLAALALSELGCCVLAYRRRSPLAATGWVTFALLVTLSWVLPWYVLWLLPLAALAGSERLRTAALILGAYLILAWVPVTSLVLRTLNFNPAKTALGQEHQRIVKNLLN